MVKLLIFDADGTLLDTDEVLFKTWEELFLLYKPKDYKIDREFVRSFSGPPIEESIKRAFPEYELDFILKEYRLRAKKYYDPYLKLFENEIEVLKKLKESGFILTIATSKNRELLEYSLDKFNMRKFFDVIVTSNDGFKTKPNPDSLNYIKDTLGYKNNESVMIGDTLFDALAAQNAHIDVILMKMCKREYESDPKASYYATSFEDLYDFLTKLS